MGRRAVKSLDSWMDEDDANKKKGGRGKEKKGGLCGNRNNAKVLEKMKIPRLEVIGIFHDREFAVCSCDESYRGHRRD